MECQQLAVAQRVVVGSIQVDVEHGVGGFAVSGLRGSRDVYDAKHGMIQLEHSTQYRAASLRQDREEEQIRFSV